MQKGHDYQPPPGGAGWTGERTYPLLYLAWGERRYGRTPMREECYGDWLYVAPKSGAPVALLNGQRRCLPAGHCLIVGPECRNGYEDKPRGRCFIQTWVWRDPPLYEALLAESGGFRIFKLSAGQRREMEAIHAACREEVQHPDVFTGDALGALRVRLDLCLARGPSGRGGQAPSGQRMGLALRWLREHLANHAPAAGLCEYLQISQSTLQRMFLAELGYTPREAALRMRLAEARRLIDTEGMSVKAAAYELGYRHPNDLSRAMSVPKRGR